MQKTFETTLKKHKKQLELYVPIVAKVHGAHHPEFYEVKKAYNAIMAKLQHLPSADLSGDFENLRNITDNYKIPNDVCESYEAVYNMLSALDKAYNA